MTYQIKLRLVILAASAGLMGLLIAFLGVKSRREVAQLRTRMNQVDSESLRIADELGEHLRQLNNSLYRYGSDHDPADLRDFLQASHQLEAWIGEHQPSLTTDHERAAMREIDAAYKGYLAVALELQAKLQALGPQSATMSAYAPLMQESHKLFMLNRALREAHLERRASILAQANQSIGQAWTFQLVSLAALFVLAITLAVMSYRHLILPLQAKLVEGQALLERHEKLASLGLLAAGVAHEIRNPLTAIKGAMFLQQKKLENGSSEYADAKTVEHEILRLERIVNNFLQFAGPGDLRLAPAAAAAPLRAVSALLGPELAKSNIRLVLEEPPPLRITVDEAQIEQVLINLVQNAADAIGRNGTVKLRARADRKRIGNKETNVVILEVADNGKGIAPEVQQRLFDPFFTTKETGTGLGLCIAAGIVQKHGGAIQYQTQVDYGTTFGIVLPGTVDHERRGQDSPH
jgi:signal transduction histidine kinase